VLVVLLSPAWGIYCQVGYGQRINQKKRKVDFWTKTTWSRNCPDKDFCWEARPAIDSAEAMVDLVGGDWNDEYWGEAGGFIYGCQGDFGFDKLGSAENSLVQLKRTNTTESGVFVLEDFKGSGKPWEFRVVNVCQENFCGSYLDSAGARCYHGTTWGVLAVSVMFSAATSLFFLGDISRS